MFNNLYTFKKNAWHVRFFKWIYNTNPTHEFKTMCPYFWSLVATFLLLPFILIIKLFGKGGTKLLNKLESWKRDKITKTKENFIKKCSKKDLTPEEAHRIYYSKCWNNFYWDLPDEVEDNIYALKNKHLNVLHIEKIKKEAKKPKSEPISYKENKLFIALSFIVSFAVIGAILFIMYNAIIELYSKYTIDWKALKFGVLIIGSIVAIVWLIVTLVIKIVPCICNKIACMRRPSWFKGSVIFKPLIFFFNGIALIGNMFYVTYKKSCPIITWEEEEKE
jgi:hypothetical protein